MTNFGALTTGYTPPAGCSATNVYLFATEGRATYMQAPLNTWRCFPDRYNPEVYGGYYSPAQCPVGYTTACISLNTINTDVETVVTCCPSYSSTLYACNTPDDRNPWLSTLGCTSVFTPTVTLTSITISMSGVTGSMFMTTETAGGMNAYSVQVRHQSGDFPGVTTYTTTARTTTTMTLPVPGVTTTVPARDVDLLSPSALAAAAGTAALIFAVLLVGSGWFWVRRGRHDSTESDRDWEERRPLIGNGAGGYRSMGRNTASKNSPPPPYHAGQPSRT
ncbi:hypothetical protein OQA88_10559 [Cercophora sp. LCS_1]